MTMKTRISRYLRGKDN